MNRFLFLSNCHAIVHKCRKTCASIRPEGSQFAQWSTPCNGKGQRQQNQRKLTDLPSSQFSFSAQVNIEMGHLVLIGESTSWTGIHFTTLMSKVIGAARQDPSCATHTDNECLFVCVSCSQFDRVVLLLLRVSFSS